MNPDDELFAAADQPLAGEEIDDATAFKRFRQHVHHEAARAVSARPYQADRGISGLRTLVQAPYYWPDLVRTALLQTVEQLDALQARTFICACVQLVLPIYRAIEAEVRPYGVQLTSPDTLDEVGDNIQQLQRGDEGEEQRTRAEQIVQQALAARTRFWDQRGQEYGTTGDLYCLAAGHDAWEDTVDTAGHVLRVLEHALEPDSLQAVRGVAMNALVAAESAGGVGSPSAALQPSAIMISMLNLLSDLLEQP